MNKKLLVVGLTAVCLFGFSNFASAGDIELNTSVEIQYRSSDKIYGSQGTDMIKLEEMYFQAKRKDVRPGTDVLLKLNAAKMNDDAHAQSIVEEAQVIFNKMADSPFTLVVGKDEMPFGQDYEKFIFANLTHGFEIDKVWGFNGKYDIDKIGKFEAAFFKKSTAKDVDTGLFESYAARITADKLMDGLSLEASYGKKGKDKAKGTSDDETRMSIGAIFKVDKATVHLENTSFTKMGGTTTSVDPSVLLFGVDYLIIDKYLVKTFYESRKDDVEGDNTGSLKDQYGIGLDRYLDSDKKVLVALEYVTMNYEDSKEDSKSEFIAAVKIGF